MGAGAVKPADAQWHETEESRGGFVCLFCGGATCKREDWRRQTDPSAIKGLHSNWVTDDVLAMQRPSSRLMREYSILAQFQSCVHVLVILVFLFLFFVANISVTMQPSLSAHIKPRVTAQICNWRRHQCTRSGRASALWRWCVDQRASIIVHDTGDSTRR